MLSVQRATFANGMGVDGRETDCAPACPMGARGPNAEPVLEAGQALADDGKRHVQFAACRRKTADVDDARKDWASERVSPGMSSGPVGLSVGGGAWS